MGRKSGPADFIIDGRVLLGTFEIVSECIKTPSSGGLKAANALILFVRIVVLRAAKDYLDLRHLVFVRLA